MRYKMRVLALATVLGLFLGGLLLLTARAGPEDGADPVRTQQVIDRLLRSLEEGNRNICARLIAGYGGAPSEGLFVAFLAARDNRPAEVAAVLSALDERVLSGNFLNGILALNTLAEQRTAELYRPQARPRRTRMLQGVQAFARWCGEERLAKAYAPVIEVLTAPAGAGGGGGGKPPTTITPETPEGRPGGGPEPGSGAAATARLPNTEDAYRIAALAFVMLVKELLDDHRQGRRLDLDKVDRTFAPGSFHKHFADVLGKELGRPLTATERDELWKQWLSGHSIRALSQLGRGAGSAAERPLASRVCLKSFPWPGGFDARGFRELRSTDMRRLREQVRSLTRRWESRDPLVRDDLSQEDRTFLDRLDAGLDPDQARLYADFLLLLVLNRENRFAEMQQLSAGVVGKEEERSAYRPTAAELVSTYYSKATLVRLIRLYHHRAAVGLIEREDNEKVLQRLAAYLDEGEIFRPLADLAGPEFGALGLGIDKMILEPLAVMNEKDIAHCPNVRDAKKSGERFLFTLQGQKQHVLEIRILGENAVIRSARQLMALN